MFDFQKLIVYQKAKTYNFEISDMLNNHSFDRHVVDQLKRASFSIMLNIAEGTSRYSAKDRRNFFIISRGSAFECVAILEYLSESERIAQEIYQTLVSKLEEISRMLFSMISKLESK
jgi:four helix bundle protein